MNKHEQILMRVWKSESTAECFRTDEHVLAHNGFAILLLNNLDRIDPNWTYDRTNDKYDLCMKMLNDNSLSVSCKKNLPDMADMKATLKTARTAANKLSVDLTEEQLCSTRYMGPYLGCLTVNLKYLYDFMWALGDNIHAFWSGRINCRLVNGVHRTAADGGLYLCGSNGQAYLMPIEREAHV